MRRHISTPIGSTLPKGWEVRPLGEMCAKIGSGATPKGGSDVYISSGVAFIRSQNVFDHHFSAAKLAFIDDYWAERLSSSEVKSKDVLLNITGDGETIARCCIAPSEHLPARVNQHVVIIRLKNEEQLDHRYLQRYMSHPRMRQFMLSQNSGGSRRALTKAQIERFPVVVPPLREQQQIADLLGVLDSRIAINDRIATTSIELAQSIFDNSTPEMHSTIDEVAVVLDGPHATPQRASEGPWFLSISSLKSGLLDLNESASMLEGDFPRWTRRVQPQKGDVLFSYETRLGDAALMLPGIRASLGRRMAVLRTKSPEVSGALLLHSYLSSTFKRQIQERAIQGATVDRIPLTDLPSWRLPLPPVDDRARYSEVLDAIHDRAAASVLEKRTAAALRDTLLPELMSGRVRVKDAEKVVETV